MSVYRGGEKKADKRKGRGHWKGRSGTRAAELAAGLVNTQSGKVMPISDSNLDGQMKLYYERQQERAIARQARTQSARARKGQYRGWVVKPGTGRHHHA